MSFALTEHTHTVGIISSVKWLSVKTVTSDDFPAFCNPMQAMSSSLAKKSDLSQSRNARSIAAVWGRAEVDWSLYSAGLEERR